MKRAIVLIFSFLTFSPNLMARSPFRKKDKDMPKITIGWKKSKKVISHTNWAYKEYPIFTSFNKDYFYSHILPTDTISDVNKPDTLINCRKLNALIEGLLKELKKQKKHYTHFVLLQNKNFN